jgi:methylated-DNA-[protein]-cysteine S-methyltransferase
MSTYVTATIASPVGPLALLGSDSGLRAVLWPTEAPGARVVWPDATREEPGHPVLRLATEQLDEYFAGRRRSFEVPLDLHGTPFQVKAWRLLATIPYGSTVIYRQQALLLGDANKARAVGAANGRNPVSIILPCHRVIGASGALTGFAGGLDVKRSLLQFETRAVKDGPIPFPG